MKEAGPLYHNHKQHRRKYHRVRTDSVPCFSFICAGKMGRKGKTVIYSTFKDYLSELKSLAFERLEEIHELILKDISGDLDAEELYGELIKTAIRYAGIRA